MHVQVINLDRSKDRWETINAWKHGFTDFNRLSAIEGKDIDYMNSDKISLKTKLYIKGNIKRAFFDINSIGAIGCALSHYKGLKDFYDNPELGEYLLMLEDDLNLDETTINYADQVNKELSLIKDKNWDVWILGMHERIAGFTVGKDNVPWSDISTDEVEIANSLKNPISFKLSAEPEYTDVRQFLGAQAIIYRRQVIPKILESFFPIDLHYDAYLSFLAQKKDIRIIHKPTFNLKQNSSYEGTISHENFNISLLGQQDYYYKIFFLILVVIIITVLIYFVFKYLLQNTTPIGKEFYILNSKKFSTH
jgi:GR25 family glycosyltransferase involved in LPS biosynthesis